MRLLLLKDKIIQGSYYPVGIVVEVSAEIAQELISAAEAIPVQATIAADEPAEDSPKKKKAEK